MSVPMVAMVVEDKTTVIDESHRLRGMLEAAGVPLDGERTLDASYSPLDGVALLILIGVDDSSWVRG